MEITIQRKIRADAYWTDGRLSVDGTEVCATLENAQYCIPKGRYTVSLVQSIAYGRKVPLLTNIENPSISAEIVFGNGAYMIRDGSIIVGESRVSGLVIYSFKTFRQIFDRIRSALRRNNDVIVTIE